MKLKSIYAVIWYIYLINTDDIMIDLREAIFTLSKEQQQAFISFLDKKNKRKDRQKKKFSSGRYSNARNSNT